MLQRTSFLYGGFVTGQWFLYLWLQFFFTPITKLSKKWHNYILLFLNYSFSQGEHLEFLLRVYTHTVFVSLNTNVVDISHIYSPSIHPLSIYVPSYTISLVAPLLSIRCSIYILRVSIDTHCMQLFENYLFHKNVYPYVH